MRHKRSASGTWCGVDGPAFRLWGFVTCPACLAMVVGIKEGGE